MPATPSGERLTPTPARLAPAFPPAGRPAPGETARTASLVLIATVLTLGALSQARLFMIPTLLAGLLALALAPAARRIERFGAPPVLAAFLLVFGSLGAVGLGAYALAPSAEALRAEAPDILRRVEQMARRLEAEVAENVAIPAEPVPPPGAGRAAPGGVPAPTAPPDVAEGEAANGDDDGESVEDGLVESGRRLLADAALGAPATVGAALYATFLAFFLLAERASLPRFVLAMAGTTRTRLTLGRAMRDVRLGVSSYLFAVSAINLGLGLCVAGAFWLIGMPSPAIWGVAMAVLNFIPYLGSLVINAAAVAVALASFATPEPALLALGALVTLSAVEANLVTPAVVGRRVEVNALAVFVAVAFGAWLWGAAGALMATPALIVLRAFALRLIRMRRPGRVQPR